MGSPWTGLPLGCVVPQANMVGGSPCLYKELESPKISGILVAQSHDPIKETLQPPGGAALLEMGPAMGPWGNPEGHLVGPAQGRAW